MKRSTKTPNPKNQGTIKKILALCLIIFLIALLVYTIQCIFSSIWNIILIVIILLTLWWLKKRRENQQPVWQGILILILAVLLLCWSLIPCIVGKFTDSVEKNKTETKIEVVEKEVVEKDDEAREDNEARKTQEACINIKGNISSSGEKIYHVPSGDFYDVTKAEEMFCTEAEAKAAGYRKSKR